MLCIRPRLIPFSLFVLVALLSPCACLDDGVSHRLSPTNAVCWSREAVVWRHGTKFCIDPSSVQSRYHFDFVCAFIYECIPVLFPLPCCSTFLFVSYLDGNLWPMDMTARHAWKHHLRKTVAVFVCFFLSLTHHRWGNVKHVLLLDMENRSESDGPCDGMDSLRR